LQTGNHGVDTACKPTGRSAPSLFREIIPRKLEFAESCRIMFIPAVQEGPGLCSNLAKTAKRVVQQQLFL